MPNPYHDENGRFCSKGEMLNAINKLAQNKQIGAYLELKASYEKITGSSSPLSQSTAEAPVEKQDAVNPAYAKLVNKYAKLAPNTIVEKLSLELDNGASDGSRRVFAAAEGSNYHPAVMQSIFNELDYATSHEERVKLASDHYPEGFGYIVDDHSAASSVMENHRPELENAIDSLSKRANFTEDVRYNLDKMVTAYANEASTETELKFALDHAVYDSVPNHYSRSALAANPRITKSVAIELLDKEIDNGASNYYQVRHNLTVNLKARGLTLKPSSKGLFNAPPIDDEPSGQVLQRQAEVQREIERYSHPAEKDDHMRNSQTYTDIYARNYQQLKNDVNKPRLTVEARNALRARILLADNRLNDIEDYSKFRDELKGLDF